MNHTIDATGRPIGRVATEVATILMGKDLPTYKANVVADVKVEIVNASKASIHPKKLKQVKYKRYSGYPSGQTEETMESVIERKGISEVFEKAVYGMLPSNRLRSIIMKNLSVSE